MYDDREYSGDGAHTSVELPPSTKQMDNYIYTHKTTRGQPEIKQKLVKKKGVKYKKFKI